MKISTETVGFLRKKTVHSELHLIPQVKKLTATKGFFTKKSLCCSALPADERLVAALQKLPLSKGGAPLTFAIGEGGEGYTLTVSKKAVSIEAEGAAGAFYAIQTLRQLFKADAIPCLVIEDKPDFPYRGFYHDMTRGKVATVETLKKLIDEMAYYKMNSLQLYVEHTFEFEECKDLNESTGCLTAEELKELDGYCKENFIEFIPSLSTFGHLYELLEQPKFQHLRTLKGYTPSANFWHERMAHHTIDPLNPESIEIIKSLIDQYYPHFETDTFNICCDETFDLKVYEESHDVGKLYVDFVKQIIAHLQGKGKKIMMWADILLKYPETIGDLPEDTIFLNWNYRAEPPEENIKKFAALGRTQIVCPGTSTWSRFCETVDQEEQNITKMADYGYRHGAIGMLNTNWGDWGNPCSLELAMYGMVLGAAKSWAIATEPNEAFQADIDALLYGYAGGYALLRKVSDLHKSIRWNEFIKKYYTAKGKLKGDFTPLQTPLAEVQARYQELSAALATPWGNDEYRQELQLAADAVCLMAELAAKMAGEQPERRIDAETFLAKYSEKWLAKNKPSELRNIQKVFTDLDA